MPPENVVMPIRLSELERPAPNEWEGIVYMVGRSLNPVVLTDGSRVSAERVFSGALMFADHPTADDEWNIPERSVRNAVGRVLSAYPGDTKDGKPALLGKFKISKAHQWLIDLIDDGIIDGLSINAYADGAFDENEGVFIIERFLDPEVDNVMPPSVDVVTYPAAGGKLWAVRMGKTFSQKRGIIIANEPLTQGIATMGTDQKTTPSFEEMQAQLSAQMKRQQEGLKAYRVALSQISHLPEQTQTRIVARIDRAVESYADNGGEVATMQSAIDAAISEETQYLQDISRAGVPRNVTQAQMGATSNEGSRDKTVQSAIAELETLFK